MTQYRAGDRVQLSAEGEKALSSRRSLNGRTGTVMVTPNGRGSTIEVQWDGRKHSERQPPEYLILVGLA